MGIRGTDIAFSHLQVNKNGVSFLELWNIVKNELGYSEELAKRKISQFYTDLSIDGRFIQLENRIWNIKINCNLQDVEAEQAEEEEDNEEDEETEEEYTDEVSEESEDY